MNDLRTTLRPALVALFAFTLLCGVIYPFAIGGIAALAFPDQARGSLVRDDNGRIIGSRLVGQAFDDPAYLWGRPAAAAYNAMASAATNQGASGFVDARGTIGKNPTLVMAVEARITALRAADPGNTAAVPVDLVTASASGLDPHISPAAARFQARRIARARGIAQTEVLAVIEQVSEGRQLIVLGEPRVNVLAANLALDARFGKSR